MNEIIQGLVERARKAQSQVADYSQEQIDRVVRAVGKRAYDEADVCARMAVEETGKGRYESKFAKHEKICLGSWLTLKNAKSVGLVEEIPELELQKFAKPVGVIACITPVTNPTSTPAGNAMHILKGRNACIICPHPAAKKSSSHIVNVMRQELREIGEPEDLIQVIEEPTMELSSALMSACDLVIATGGPGMVKAAYSSGKPSYGVGQGNVQVVVDPKFEDYELLANNVVGNRLYDYGMPCTTEQTVHIPVEKVDLFVKLMRERKCFYVEDPEDIQKLRNAAFTNGIINRRIVGRSAQILAAEAEIEIPDDTTLLVCKVDAWGREEPLAREIMAPFVRILPYTDVNEAIEHARINFFMEGAGHVGCIYSEDKALIEHAGDRLPVGRLVVNQNASAGSGAPQNNGLNPTISLGCGFWGGNSISENLIYKHMLNYTLVSKIIKDKKILTPEEIWGA